MVNSGVSALAKASTSLRLRRGAKQQHPVDIPHHHAQRCKGVEYGKIEAAVYTGREGCPFDVHQAFRALDPTRAQDLGSDRHRIPALPRAEHHTDRVLPAEGAADSKEQAGGLTTPSAVRVGFANTPER